MNKYNSDINPKNYYGEALDLKDSDERLKEFQEQRLKRGFDESECWSIDYVIVSFALPRIKRLLEIEENIHGQITEEAEGSIDFECEEYLRDLKQIVKDLESYDNNSTDLSLFFKRFKQLWY